MRKKLILLCMVVGLLLPLSCGCGVALGAEPVYQITETELNRLEKNLQQLADINKKQSGMLKQARFDLEELQAALTSCKQELKLAQNSLQNANTLLAQYEKEERSRRLKIKRQRNFAYTLATSVAIGFAYREIKRK